MLKLYNLFEEVILESVSDDEIIKAIDGKYNVNILYQDDEGKPPSRRYIQIYVLGVMPNGLKAIRAFQITGGSKTISTNTWKIFRVDRIVEITPTNMKFYKPISFYSDRPDRYNFTGDRKGNFKKGESVDTFANIIKRVQFDDKHLDTISTTFKDRVNQHPSNVGANGERLEKNNSDNQQMSDYQKNQLANKEMAKQMKGKTNKDKKDNDSANRQMTKQMKDKMNQQKTDNDLANQQMMQQMKDKISQNLKDKEDKEKLKQELKDKLNNYQHNT